MLPEVVIEWIFVGMEEFEQYSKGGIIMEANKKTNGSGCVVLLFSPQLKWSVPIHQLTPVNSASKLGTSPAFINELGTLNILQFGPIFNAYLHLNPYIFCFGP